MKIKETATNIIVNFFSVSSIATWNRYKSDKIYSNCAHSIQKLNAFEFWCVALKLDKRITLYSCILVQLLTSPQLSIWKSTMSCRTTKLWYKATEMKWERNEYESRTMPDSILKSDRIKSWWGQNRDASMLKKKQTFFIWFFCCCSWCCWC